MLLVWSRPSRDVYVEKSRRWSGGCTGAKSRRGFSHHRPHRSPVERAPAAQSIRRYLRGATANWTENCLHQTTTLFTRDTSVPAGTR